MSAKNRSFVDHIWEFFCSLKLAIITLILLAVTSIIGTVIQQGKPAQEYIQEYGESTYKLFLALDFVDMYHSWWFLTLLNVFAINLICCSIKRLPRILKLVREPNRVAEDGLYRTLSNFEEIVTSASLQDVSRKAQEYVTKNFGKPDVTEQDGKVYLFAQKTAWARFGVYVTHISILIIFVGAIMGNVWGYKAYVNVVEGTSTDEVWPRSGKEPIKLGFEVRCDRFAVEYYPGSTRPKEFTSDLVVLENGQEILKKTIEVNDPLSYKGITFYQSSYGQMGDAQFIFKVTERETGTTKEVRARRGEMISLPGGGGFRVVDFTEQFQNFGAAARIEVVPELDHDHKPGEKHASFVVLKAFPEFDSRRGGKYIFSLQDFKQKYYTGLQVAKDPGVWVVWLGCFLMVVGSMSAFFLSHRRVWLTIQPVDDKTGIKVGASAHRNQPAFEIYFDEFKKNLKTELSE
ncbi:MAG: cytochrome c biogenesis protein ResB [Desulfuromonas sp.]|nr:MAG: cytochrome c biogenesis protein ResB [Desulfuromonas sp.]